MQNNERQYRPHLFALMNFIRAENDNDNGNYAAEHEFSQEELLTVRPEHVCRFFAMKAFGTATPGPDDRPNLCRSSTIAFSKKAISYFMPNRLPTWNVDTQAGNPTKSVSVNNLIKRIKRHEVRNEGVGSSAVRPLEPAEFVSLIKHVMAMADPGLRFGLSAYYKFQCHMITRVDDAAQLMLENLKPHPAFPFALLCKVNWSKNVLEERDASDQILLASSNHHYCILLALALYLEWRFQNNAAHGDDRVFPLSNSIASSKAKASTMFKKTVEKATFERVGDNNLGTHSLRKFPATMARRKGCTRDDVDHRGRWRSDKRVVDRYIHCELPYPDAKVAAALCGDGAIKYEYKEGTAVNDEWIVVHVTPNIKDRMGHPIAVVLGKSLLWAVMSNDETFGNFLPAAAVARIRSSYETLAGNNENPIQKIYLTVSGSEGAVFINEVGEQAAAAARRDGVVPGNHEGTELLGLYSQVEGLKRQLDDTRRDIENLRALTEARFDRIGRQVRRVALQPVARVVGNLSTRRRRTGSGDSEEEVNEDEEGPGGGGQPATLVKTPRTLDELWMEYNFGLGGRKPARLFTRHERGKCKYTYCRRRVVWQKVAELIRAGDTAQVAIDKIRLAYGESLPVTTIINRMMADRRRGGHPSLRVR